MAQDDPAMSLEPYCRGARFALVAIKQRHPDDTCLAADVDTWASMLRRFEAAAVATYRMRRAAGVMIVQSRGG